jgi:CelD/BcsL family acetyltransferase involved in cellulose biosynthesis
LVRNGYEAAFPELILNELCQDSKAWDILCYKFSYSFSQYQGLFSEELLNRFDFPWERLYQPTYTVLLNKSFEEYFHRDLTSKHRKTIKLNKNRLAKAGSHTFVLYQGNDSVKFWSDFLRIEDSCWKGKAGSSIKRLETNFLRFYEGLVKIFANKKVLSLYFLSLNGRAIAGAFGYVEANTFHYVKSGYDDQFKRLSPSNLLFIYIIEHLITKCPEINRIHMFPWDYGYKHRFANDEAFCIETLLFSNTFRGKSTRLLFTIKKKFKTLLKRQTGNI